MGQFALFISWTLFILWGFFRYQPNDFSTGVMMLGTLYLLFSVNALANRLVRSEPVTVGDIQQATTNNIAFYFSALIVFGFGEFGNHLAAITGWVFIFMLCLAMITYFLFPSVVVLQRSQCRQSCFLRCLLASTGMTNVTLLWVALAVVLFVLEFTIVARPRLAEVNEHYSVN